MLVASSLSAPIDTNHGNRVVARLLPPPSPLHLRTNFAIGMHVRMITGAQARSLLSVGEAIAVNANAFRQHFGGSVVNPDRLIVRGAHVLVGWVGLRPVGCLW